MALSKVNFNSMNVTPAASKAIKFNSSNNGLETGDIGGSLVLISTQNASSSSTISFTSGIDSTYKEYIFKFINIHPSNDNVDFYVNFSVDGGSNYNVTKTTLYFRANHVFEKLYLMDQISVMFHYQTDHYHYHLAVALL